MIGSILYFITALIALEAFGQARPAMRGMGGAATVFAVAIIMLIYFLLGYVRVIRLTARIKRIIPAGDPRIQQLFESWKNGYQVGTVVVYVMILWLTGWGHFVHSTLGLSRAILLDEFMGLLPYFVLLVIYWSLSFVFQQAVTREEWSFRGYLIFNMHLTLMPVIPLIFFMGMFDLLYYLPYPLCLWLGSGQGPADMLMVLAALAIIGFFFPWFLVKFWRCKPMAPGPRRLLLEAVCRERGLTYRDIMIWDIGEGKFLNAGVMGLTRHFRYVLFTRRILDVMDDEELIAVLGHEIGHARKHHILLNILISFGFLSFFVIASAFLGGISMLLLPLPIFQEFIMLGTTVGIVVLYWRVVFGFISRRFERQADLYGADVAGGPRPMIAALEKLAAVSGRPRELPNWTHHSVAARVDFLEDVLMRPAVARDFQQDTRRFVRKLGIMAAVMFLLAFTYLTLTYSPGAIINSWFEDGRYDLVEKHYFQRLAGRALDEEQKAESFNAIAWMYATSRTADYRRPGDALYYAQQAVDIILTRVKRGDPVRNSKNTLSMYVDTLAAAHYALGDADMALHYSEIAVEICPVDSPHLEDIYEAYVKHRDAAARGDKPI